MSSPCLRLSIDCDYDWLICTTFGFVDDGVPADSWEALVDERVAAIRHPETGQIVGFAVREWSGFDASEHELLFALGHRFTVPQLGLADASIGAICLAARAWLGNEHTVDRAYFHAALAVEEPSDALAWWLLCLEAGDMQAHYALGYTYLALDDAHRSYRHLRAYTELAPWNGWGWCFLGRACAALGETTEAGRAFKRAVAIEADGGYETDAGEYLEALEPRR